MATIQFHYATFGGQRLFYREAGNLRAARR
jgi:hypothetical protein